MFLNTDEDIETVFSSIMPFITSEVEEICPFDDKSDEQREEILKVALKSVEVTVYILNRLVNDKGLDREKLNELKKLIDENNLEKASELFK